MYAPYHDFFRSLRLAGKAVRRGDVATAERWTRLAERHLALSHRFDLQDAEIEKAGQPATPPGPVMLDPKGYSPGGHPNWYLNQQRLERAGIRGEAARRHMSGVSRETPAGGDAPTSPHRTD